MFHQKRTLTFLIILFISLLTPNFIALQAESSEEPELFAAKGGIGAGLLFDDQGNMYLGTNSLLLKIRPDGSSSTFCDLGNLPFGKDYFFPSPMVWDMVMDKDQNIIAAAQDSILKITPAGEVTILVQQDFIGFCGSSGLALDRQGNLYVTNGPKIIKYTPDLKASVYIDGIKSGIKNPSFFSADFDPEYKNLYLCDFNNQTLIKYPINPDGTPGQPVTLAQFPSASPLNVIFGDQGNIYVSIDLASTLLKIQPDGAQTLIPIKGANHIIAFGGKGFDEKSIYYTTYNGRIFKVGVGERAARADRSPDHP